MTVICNWYHKMRAFAGICRWYTVERYQKCHQRTVRFVWTWNSNKHSFPVKLITAACNYISHLNMFEEAIVDT